MPARPRRGALGLRGRIVGAVLVTTVATLVVAAVTLLGPLENRLRAAAQTTLERDLGNHAAAIFDGVDLSRLSDHDTMQTLTDNLSDLATRVSGSAYVLGYPSVTGQGVLQPTPTFELGAVEVDLFDDVFVVFRIYCI